MLLLQELLYLFWLLDYPFHLLSTAGIINAGHPELSKDVPLPAVEFSQAAYLRVSNYCGKDCNG
jgi:hypothetical protein